MLSQVELERSLRRAVQQAEREADTLSAEDREALNALKAALGRLKANPRLVSGDPTSDFTYADPILAAIVQSLRQKPHSFGQAGKKGADLRKKNLKWLMIPIKIALDFSGTAWEMLERRVSYEPFPMEVTPLRLAVFGDGGYVGQAQKRVLASIVGIHGANPFHAAIHLGDIYFAGKEDDVRKQFLSSLGPLLTGGVRVFEPVRQPRSLFRSIALRFSDEPA